MGLAASQARLLTITSRKSRAQFESMRMSHQKLALSRSLTEISNEYQNSLDQTKLYYDFYGVNSTDTPLTYNLLMSPSSLNDYTPTILTNNQGQVILSTPYAEAARAAGIPQEGLGCTPSSIMRDAFIMGLAAQGVITQGTAEAICGITYNQGAGLGSDNLVNTVQTECTYDELLNMLESECQINNLTFPGIARPDNKGGDENPDKLVMSNGDKQVLYGGTSLWANGDVTPGYGGGDMTTATESVDEVSFADLLNGNYYLSAEFSTSDKWVNWNGNIDVIMNAIAQITDAFSATLSGMIVGAGDAAAYADSQMQDLAYTPQSENYSCGKTYQCYDRNGNKCDTKDLGRREDSQPDYYYSSMYATDNFLGIAISRYGRAGNLKKNRAEAVASINISDFLRAWFTYFMQYLYGLGTAKANSLNIEWGQDKDKSTFANADNIGDYKFVVEETTVSDSDALIANFYDTLFNQICINGWSENNQVATDSNYLKEMLQSGMMYVTSMSDDYYYYQNNYSTNNFIKEVSDDAAIAAAESKYTTQKARINAKEQELDLKMKNLDTEISSLETEYEAVKKVIEDNVSKSFTRYDS